MYQVTFFDCGELVAISTPSYRAIEAVYFQLPRACRARLWKIQHGRTRLLHHR